MKLFYSYTKYPYSYTASDWSRRKSKLLQFSIIIVLLGGMFIHILLRYFLNMEKTTAFIIGVVISLVCFISYIVYCGKQEKFHAACGLFAQKFQRPPTEEEKKNIHEILKNK